jgi:hypothetical protein
MTVTITHDYFTTINRGIVQEKSTVEAGVAGGGKGVLDVGSGAVLVSFLYGELKSKAREA